MNCCGMKRLAPPATPAPPTPAPTEPGPVAPVAARPASVSFQYTGATRLVAEGPISRQRYRFDAPGAVVGVDARDAAAFAAIPALRRLR